MKIKNALYSAKADEQFGHSIWADQNGKHVKVTCVLDDLLEGYFRYGWDDKVFVGQVVRFVNSNRNSSWLEDKYKFNGLYAMGYPIIKK